MTNSLAAHARSGLPSSLLRSPLVGSAVRGGRLSHSYLLVGPPGVGKARAALWLGRIASCHSPRVDDTGVPWPCEECPSCVIRFEPGRHHDLLMLDPAVKERGEAGKTAVAFIDQVRQAIRAVSGRALVGRRRILVLLHIEDFSLNAANSLLKTIEEPPGSAMVLLTANAPEVVLPTIRSRCQLIQLAPDTVDAAAEDLGPGEEAKAAAVLAVGRLEAARALCQSGRAGAISAEMASVLDHLTRGVLRDSLMAGSRLRKLCALWAGCMGGEEEGRRSAEEEVRSGSNEVLGFVEHWFEAELRRRSGIAPGPLGEFGGAELASRLRALRREDLVAALRHLAQARRAIRSNVNTRLALDVLAFRLGRSRSGTMPPPSGT